MYEQINGQMVTWIKGVCTKAVPLKWYFLMEHSIESIFLHRSFIMSLQHVRRSLHIVFWLANEFKFSMCWILFVPCLLHSYPGCSLIASLALPDIGVWVARRGAQGRGVFNCHIQGGRGRGGWQVTAVINHSLPESGGFEKACSISPPPPPKSLCN